MPTSDSGALVEALLASAHDAVWIVARDAALTRYNGAFARLCSKAFRRVPAAGVLLTDIVPDTAELFVDLFRRAMSGRAVTADTTLNIDGVTRTFIVGGAPVIADGTVVGAAFAAHDITESARRAREDLFELSLTRLFFEGQRPMSDTIGHALEYICRSDEWDGGIIWLVDGSSLVVESMHGENLDDSVRGIRLDRGQGLAGRSWADDDLAWAADLLDETDAARTQMSKRLSIHSAVAVPVRDGARIIGVIELFSHAMRPISEIRGRALLRAGADLGRLIARRRDEDERRRLLEIIERKGLEWTVTFDAIELPIFIATTDGQIRRVNRAARDLSGAEYVDVVGRPLASFGENEPWLTLTRCVEAMRDSNQPITAQAFHPADERSWDIAGSCYRSAEEESVLAILAVRETTTLVRLQESVRRGEQLAALGELVAGVAHEVRNPIFGMQIAIDTLEATATPTDDVRELLQAIRGWLARMNRLMENLLDYGKTWTIDLKEGSLSDVLAEAVGGTQPVAASAEVLIEPEIADTPPILMDASRLTRAFENLITNAVQHSKRGERVVVRTEVQDGFVTCSVRDFGDGFNEADLPRIFQPFYTKRRGGTGLGLSIVQRIVDEHGGTVRAKNAATGGAIVTVRFPIYPALRLRS
jgi:signal transduction histidine kinase/putative methionine-R-sulfoxide reductase with GAF domain